MDQKIQIDLPTPHSKIQKMIMESFIDPGGPIEVYVACGTKLGKTLGCSVALAAAMPTSPATNWRWLAPYYSQSVIGYDNLKAILPGAFTRARRSSMEIEIPSIRTSCKFIHGQNPELIEGHQIHGWVLDEAAKIKEEIYYSCRTTVTRTRSSGMGRMLVPSTPLGRNWFYKNCMEARDEMQLAKLNNRKPRSLFLTAPTSENPFIAPSVIEAARLRLPDRLFRQYYLAEFLEESSVFTGVTECLFGIEFSMSSGKHSAWFDRAAEKCSVVIGADWARGKTTSADSTVFTAINYECSPCRVVGILKLRGLNYTDQIAHLVRFSRKFKDCFRVMHDKTGVGVAIDDQMELTGLVYEGKTFTLQSKSEMVCGLITAIEQQRLEIPHCADLIEELDAFEMDVTPQGHMKFAAAQGNHDDMVCSLMLAWTLARRYADTDVEFRSLDDIKANKTPIASYYDDVLSDEDDLYGDWIETINAVRTK